jgi:PilZ domain
LPVWFRVADESCWRQSQTENISASGVLVRCPEPLPLDTTVEFRFTLPANHTAQVGGEVAGRGRVARIVEAPVERTESGFAIAIEQYNLRPQLKASMTRH